MNLHQADKQKVFKIIDNYLIDSNSILGSGQYGNVYKGYEINNYGRLFAIKETLLSRKNVNLDTFTKKKEAAIREINSLKELNHPNIIRFINAKKTDKHLYLIMEYCSGGSLEKFIEENRPEERECLYLFSQIINAFKYLIKEKKRRHGDIKPANILLNNEQIKIADFGFSKQFVEENEQFYSYTGSPLYTALQILEGKAYTTKSEIWSLGVTLYFMLCYNPERREASFPWWGGTDVHLVKNIKQNPVLKFSQENEEKLSPQVKQLLHKMLQVEEEKRIDWDELFSCPIFTFDYAQEIIYDEYQEDDDENEDQNNGLEELKQQLDDQSYAKQLFTASFIDSSQIATSQKSNEKDTNLSSSINNMKQTSLNGSGNVQLTQSDEIDNQMSTLGKSKKITSIDVVHQQIYRGNNCLNDIQQGEKNSKLMQDLKEYIDQERQLYFFVYNTAKNFKDSFERLQLFFSSQKEAKLIEAKVLYILCKRANIISKELLNDIEQKRSAHLLKGGAGSNSNLGLIQSTNQTLQQSKYTMINNPNLTNSNMNNQKQINNMGKSVKNQNLMSQICFSNSVIVISRDHWNYFSKNLNMKQSYEDKLRQESKIFSQNFIIYKQKLENLLNTIEKIGIEDKQIIVNSNDNVLNLNYESIVIGEILQIFLYDLQRISNKIMNQAHQNSQNILAILNEEDLKLIYLIDDLFMIYCFESTFRNRVMQKKDEKINIQQFYFLRKNSNPLFLIQRLTTSYKTFFFPS
ncbi:hypothetical protein ABPG74_015029 [Tetrahymena malaccensis]